MQLTGIHIYPIKSIAGISVIEAEVQEKGLRYDRRLMLVDEKGKFITQRDYPKLSLIKSDFQDQELVLKYENGYSRKIKISPREEINEAKKVEVWSSKLRASLVSSEADDFFSTFLEFKCHLVKMNKDSSRYVDPHYSDHKTKVSFADGYPFLLIGESSLEVLNNKLDEPVSMTRFRPNLVFKGGDPFGEDIWQDFMIGDVMFRAAKPCSRCVMTTVNSGSIGTEPLRTLSKFRKKGNNIHFGMNLIALSKGSIRVGDQIKIL